MNPKMPELPDPRTSSASNRAERGVVLITAIAVMIPLLVVVMGATTLMTGRNSTLLRSIQETKALFAAEAGIEEAAQRAQSGVLVPGEVYTRDLGLGMTNSVIATYLATDGVDNDGDTLIDDQDERAFEVKSFGYHGQAVRRLSAIVVEPDVLPPWQAAILVLGDPIVEMGGSSQVSGYDVNLDGTRGAVTNDVAGIANQPPYDTLGLTADYNRHGSAVLTGKPLLSTTTQQFNLPSLAGAVRETEKNVVPPGTYKGYLGDSATGDWQVSYCPGDLRINGNVTGAGILFVEGGLRVEGEMVWDGLVVVMGDFHGAGNSTIRGAVIQGPDASSLATLGSSLVQFSTEALSQIPSLLTPAFDIVGMREISQW